MRIIAATHRDLRQLIRSGTFREDLFYRLNVVPIRLPPLRERTEDIPVLARHFLEKSQQSGLAGKILSEEAMERLQAHRWAGNVRELENLMHRLSALYPQELISADVISAELAENAVHEDPQAVVNDQERLAHAVERHIRQFLASAKDGMPMRDIYDRVIAEIERPLIQMTLASTKGNQIKAAAMLGLTATRCARRSATWRSRSCAASADRMWRTSSTRMAA